MTSLLEAPGLAIPGRLQAAGIVVEAGSMAALIGPNGSGKTSLLRALAGIEGDGSVRIAGEEAGTAVPARRPKLLSFLPASREMVWPIRARDVIALGGAGPERVDELLALLELDDLAGRPVSQLSTGERARVLLARALAARPRLLLLDEPLSNLDPYWVLRILGIVRDAVEQGTAALVSLHDIDRADAFDRVMLMDGGRIIADMPPAAMLASRELAAAFRIERSEAGWRISPPAGRRSLP